MSPKQRQSRPESSQKDSERSGVVREGKPKSKALNGRTEPLVKSILIEPRHNEPPRVSVSVTYQDKPPSVNALQKAAMGAIHDVVRREGKLEDLGYRAHQTQRTLTQTFSLEEK